MCLSFCFVAGIQVKLLHQAGHANLAVLPGTIPRRYFWRYPFDCPSSVNARFYALLSHGLNGTRHYNYSLVTLM